VSVLLESAPALVFAGVLVVAVSPASSVRAAALESSLEQTFVSTASALVFAAEFAIGKRPDAPESVSALFSAENFVVGDTPASMASE